MPTPTPEVEEMRAHAGFPTKFHPDFDLVIRLETAQDILKQTVTSLTQKHKEEIEKAREEERGKAKEKISEMATIMWTAINSAPTNENIIEIMNVLEKISKTQVLDYWNKKHNNQYSRLKNALIDLQAFTNTKTDNQ